MTLTIDDPVGPMLAKAVDAVPDPDSVDGGLLYEPKWDGFRSIVYVGAGGAVDLGSRGSKPLTRYFPELVEALAERLPPGCVVDGEIVVRVGEPGRQKLDWEALSQRIHPAASRVRLLSEQTPASFVAFDLLQVEGENLLERPFAERRAALETLLADTAAPVHLTQTTREVAVARRWLEEFEGAGLDGVVAKPLAAAYAPGKRVMLKAKHHRTADVVVVGYRVHTSGTGVGSLLLGLYDEAGTLRNVGGASAFTAVRRRELIDELEPDVLRDDDGEVVRGETERSRFSSSKDVSYVRLEPRRVVEVRYDQMEGDRFRHTVQFARWRPDRDARSCTFEQLEVPARYDLGDVLA
jgi:ATP-dependent DNA ligase